MTLTSTLALLFGIFLGVVGYASILLVIGANRHEKQSRQELDDWIERGCPLSVRREPPVDWFDARLPPIRREPPPMPVCKPAREPDLWDVAQAAEQEPGVRYEFLGITGLERE
jgi:hypothetical protein